jgi:hypothetical protein
MYVCICIFRETSRESATGDGTKHRKKLPGSRTYIYIYIYINGRRNEVEAAALVRACMCVCVCARACVRACVYVCLCVTIGGSYRSAAPVKIGDFPANLLINQGVMASLQKGRLLEHGTSRFLTLRINHYAAQGITTMVLDVCVCVSVCVCARVRVGVSLPAREKKIGLRWSK